MHKLQCLLASADLCSLQALHVEALGPVMPHGQVLPCGGCQVCDIVVIDFIAADLQNRQSVAL